MATSVPDRPALDRRALDRIEWPLTLSVLAYGVRIGVRINDPGVAERLACHLPPGSEHLESVEAVRTYSLIVQDDDPGGGGARSSMCVDDAVLVGRSTAQAVLRAFESDVKLYVAEMAPDRVFVHAGVVGFRGRAILLPGRSFSGKTTLVAALVRAGAEYYSDEYAVLDAAGDVHPYPGPLSIRRAGGAGATKCPVHALGGHAGSQPLPAGLVVVTEFRSGGKWRPRRLSPGRGALKLLANTVPARRIPATVLATLHQVVSRAPVVATERGEASDVVEPILELAARS
jgi:hypothetical protein